MSTDVYAETAMDTERTAFRTSRLLDFCSEKELVTQTGHDSDEWPLVILKELLDNALDACEEAGTPPKIKVRVSRRGITVIDNGPGIPPATVAGVLDYSVRVSSREAYQAPDRGAQGNAMKTIMPMEYALTGNPGRVVIEAQDIRHEIVFRADPIRQEPVIDYQEKPGFAKTGTSVQVDWSCALDLVEDRFLQMASDFALLNPHLDLTVRWFGREWRYRPTDPEWGRQKWTPRKATSAHWYCGDEFNRLLAAHIAHDQDAGRDRPLREIVMQFDGLRGSAKQKKVLDDTGLTRAGLSALRNGDGLDHEKVASLHTAMKKHTKPIRATALGFIGKDHFHQKFTEMGAEMETFEYRKLAMEDDEGRPVVIEAAFAWRGDCDVEQRVVVGVNWSAAIGNPFRRFGHPCRGLDGFLAEQRAGRDEPIIFAFHVAGPGVRFTDRGKSAIITEHFLDQTAVDKTAGAVTRKWAKQRKAEEKNASRHAARRDRLIRQERWTVKDAAWAVMPDAYHKASGGGKLPAMARQIMYAARGAILELTGNTELNDSYFTQRLLPDYIVENPEETAHWNVTYDARGHLVEPHTEKSIPLGTLDVRRYLKTGEHISDGIALGQMRLGGLFPTKGPTHRYSAILFVEKEGFLPLFEQVDLANRFDIAIMSTKGLPVVACRKLADELCGERGVKLFVLHDFDKAGFSILGTLRGRSGDRYLYSNQFDVVDLGLRLEDAEAYGLEAEAVTYGKHAIGKVRANLRRNGATPEEIDFLCCKDGWQARGKRVELNAFPSDQFVDWIEGKLREHGVEKVVPDDGVIEQAYRRALAGTMASMRLQEVEKDINEAVAKASIPVGLTEQALRERLSANPGTAWDQIVAGIARQQVAKHSMN